MIKKQLGKYLQEILKKSVESAVKEQGLSGLVRNLEKIVPDITEQYSTRKLDTAYLQIKARGLHGFQISLINEVIGEFEKPAIADIGDSAGTHLQYLIGLYSLKKAIKCFSINLDPEAVKKIKQKGLEAFNMRAEELSGNNIKADIFLCFELLEHMTDPCKFLYALSQAKDAKYLIITVPYVKKSRVGLQHIRFGNKGNMRAENTHIFELSPEDWKLLVKHSGWKVTRGKIYFQYPRIGLYALTKAIWKKLDFEGFYGLILERDDTWSSLYKDWPDRVVK